MGIWGGFGGLTVILRQSEITEDAGKRRGHGERLEAKGGARVVWIQSEWWMAYAS
jgi:hypothetical protein